MEIKNIAMHIKNKIGWKLQFCREIFDIQLDFILKKNIDVRNENKIARKKFCFAVFGERNFLRDQ